MENVTQVVPSKTEKQIEENKKLFGRRIKQLSAIIKDENYIPKGSTSGYHDFIFSMYQALVTGRKITPKMENSITNIVKSYAKTLNPEYKKEKLDYIENTIAKLNMITRKLHEANYTSSYTDRSEYFLRSIKDQVHRRGKLSIKQRKALNQMYKRFMKKIEKNEKIKKRIKKVKKKLDLT